MLGVPADEKWGRVPVRCFGRWWHLADVPAVDWIMAAASPDMAGVFPGLVDFEDGAELFRMCLSLPDMQRRCANVSARALERASGGREAHWVANFANEALASWPFLNGPMVRAGVRADATKFADWIDAAYSWLAESLVKKDKEALDNRLRRLPKGVAGTAKPRMSTRAELLAFAKD